MNVVKATRNFERWLRAQLRIVEGDLREKHKLMTQDEFLFFRGTFYRWAQIWPKRCTDLASAPKVFGVGDLHVGSCGTWRDKVGRLVWGIDDFDEAFPVPYTNDLVRLAASARLATSLEHLAINSKDACDAILQGYMESLQSGGSPIVLENANKWLVSIALSRLDNPADFWKKMESNPTARKPFPAAATKAWKQMFPEIGLKYRVVKRTAGTGSLGHERLVAIAEWRGGKFALEAKILAPSAWGWAQGKVTNAIYSGHVIQNALQCRDPFMAVRNRWLIKRLAPDSCPIEIETLPKKRQEDRLLHAAGWEAANIHLGSRHAAHRVQRDLKKRRAGWLRVAAKEMCEAVNRDWKHWRKENL